MERTAAFDALGIPKAKLDKPFKTPPGLAWINLQELGPVRSFSAELRLPGAPDPLTLVSWISGDVSYGDVTLIPTCLDARVDRGTLVIGTYNGLAILLGRGDIAKPNSGAIAWTGLPTNEWTMSAVPRPKQYGEVSMKLTCSEAGRWKAEVTHRWDDAQRTTVFEQTGDEWRFDRLRKGKTE